MPTKMPVPSPPDDLRLAFSTESHHKIDAQSGGELRVRDAYYESPGLRCSSCVTA